MARYFKKRRYGKYGKKKRYGKMGYRKMKRSKAKLYRQGGNYAMSTNGKPSVELKSYDLICANNRQGTLVANSISGALNTCDAYAESCIAFASQFPGASAPWLGATIFPSVMEACNQQAGVCLNSLLIGAGLNQRVGRKITMRSIKIDMCFMSPGTLSPDSEYGVANTRAGSTQLCPVRVLLVYDRQTNGAVVNSDDVLAPLGTSGVQGGGNAVGVCSSNNLNNRSRFLTLFDKTYLLNAVDTPYRTIRIYKKMNLPVIYSSNAPTNPWDVNVIQTGGLFLFAICDCDPSINLAAVTGPPLSQVIKSPMAVMPSSRLRFTDS